MNNVAHSDLTRPHLPQKLQIENPKRQSKFRAAAEGYYDYYAGYTLEFSKKILTSADLPKNAVVFDPWNGTGTTLAAAAELGFSYAGCDLNPVMVLVAKGRLASQNDIQTAHHIWRAIENDLADVRRIPSISDVDSDPLLDLFDTRASSWIRYIEKQVRRALFGTNKVAFISMNQIDNATSVAGFLYTALFRATRLALAPLVTSNPTWFKRPGKSKIRLKPSHLIGAIRAELDKLAPSVACTSGTQLLCASSLFISSSTNLPLADGSVDAVLTSPPYCTRIDYAIASIGELAVLGIGEETGLDDLRRGLMGATTVPKSLPTQERSWGHSCNDFLDQVAVHTSVASNTYYLKNHLQYFADLFLSLGELSRVLKSNGLAMIVVQDSYYKDIHNDLPAIVEEMSAFHGLKIFQRESFLAKSDMRRINSRSESYRSTYLRSYESVLCLTSR